MSYVRYWFLHLMCAAGLHDTGTKRNGYCERPNCGQWVSS